MWKYWRVSNLWAERGEQSIHMSDIHSFLLGTSRDTFHLCHSSLSSYAHIIVMIREVYGSQSQPDTDLRVKTNGMLASGPEDVCLYITDSENCLFFKLPLSGVFPLCHSYFLPMPSPLLICHGSPSTFLLTGDLHGKY